MPHNESKTKEKKENEPLTPISSGFAFAMASASAN